MQIDIFNEIQNPRPWNHNTEHERLFQAIEQAKLADELGYGCWWQVEHHGAEEFSLSSAPELLLTAISQHTKRIRLGHAAVLAPGKFNHPIRAAERAATLDHLSGGRLEFGLTRSTIPEWRLFNIDPADVRPQTAQAFEMIPQMWTSDRFSYASDHYRVDDVRIAPKPLQKPHPPLWQAATSPSSFEDAGRRGVGVLGTTLWQPLSRVHAMVDLYRRAIAECTSPVGSFVNDQIAFFTFVHCADTDEEAMRNGAATAAAWYTTQALTFFEAQKMFLETATHEQTTRSNPLATDFIQAESTTSPTPAQLLIGRILAGETPSDDEIFTTLSSQDSLIVGSPATCRAKMEKYAALGIDRLLTFHQVAHLAHPAVLTSIRLTSTLIPAFTGKG